MPKKVLESLVREIKRDIASNYRVGDRYLTMRQIAERFEVSLQSAQKGVALLEEEGLVQSRKKSGIFIAALESCGKTEGKRLLVLSNKQDRRFYQVFLDGVKKRMEGSGVSVDLIVNTDEKTNTLAFGDYLLSLHTDGIIALSFLGAALPFYHALREGLDIVSDIIMDELPILPAVQTDNYRHAHRAGELFLEQGYKDFYVFGFYPERNRRFQGFSDAVRPYARSVAYVHLSDYEAMAKTDAIFNNLSPSTALFSCDYSTNYILASQFLKHRGTLRPTNFLAYDSEGDFFHHAGLPPVRCVAPSFFDLGEALGQTLLTKWRSGAYPTPLQQKI